MKHPEPGKVKTRLARGLGTEAAVEIYRRLVVCVFEVLAGLKSTRIRVLYDPPGKGAEVEAWISGLWDCRGSGTASLEFAPQTSGDLGRRLQEAFVGAFADGFEAAAVVGTDCVDISRATFSRTWDLLCERDVVYGPSPDGGYYLLAMKRPWEALFDGIPWSSEKTLEASLRAAEAAGLSVGLLETLRDVDEPEDWRAVEGRMKDEAGS